MILSKFKKLTDLPMDERQDQNWCLERFAGTSTGDGGPLKMRPCETGKIKQMWSYHKQKKVIASLSGEITTTTNETTAAGFCITRSGRDLVSTLCTSRPENVDTIISDEALNFSQNDTSTGSISIKAGNKEFYLAIDSIRIFSRVKLLKKGTENSSYDKWQLRYKGPSEFPSSIPSSNPSDFPVSAPVPAPISVVNIARESSASAWQSSFYTNDSVASKAIDGNTSGDRVAQYSVTHTAKENNPSWYVSWPAAHRISRIKVWNRTDNDYGPRLINFVLTVYLDGEKMWSSAASATSTNKVMYDFNSMPGNIVGDKVEVKLSGTNRILSLAEVQVFGHSNEIYNVAIKK